MSSSTANRYTSVVIDSVIRIASSLLDSWDIDARGLNLPRMVGTLFINPISEDLVAIQSALGRMKIPHVDLSTFLSRSLSRAEFDHQFRTAENAVDMLITSFYDSECFGNGRRLLERASTEATRSIVNYADDVLSPQGALAEILGLHRALGSLRGKKIAVSWVFGNRFASPNIAHSLLQMLPLVQADIRVVAPAQFPLLNRIRHEADTLASERKTSIEYTTEFHGAFNDVDAIFALNWGGLDNFQRPARNTEDAAEYRDWYFVDDTAPEHTPTLFVPPAQVELSMSDGVLSSNFRYSHTWLSRRVAALMGTIIYLAGSSDTWLLL
jgi:ornithine carbamoyltransferase